MDEKEEELLHRDVASKGGHARAKKLSATKRREIASFAGKISAAKKKARRKEKQKDDKKEK